MRNIVTAKEVARYLRISESTVYKLAVNGELPAFKVGDSWRFYLEEIEEMIKSARTVKSQSTGLGPP